MKFSWSCLPGPFSLGQGSHFSRELRSVGWESSHQGGYVPPLASRPPSPSPTSCTTHTSASDSLIQSCKSIKASVSRRDSVVRVMLQSSLWDHSEGQTPAEDHSLAQLPSCQIYSSFLFSQKHSCSHLRLCFSTPAHTCHTGHHGGPFMCITSHDLQLNL